MNLDAFQSHLSECTKLSSSTIASYVKNVKRCLKKEDVDVYITSIKSASHRSFVKSSWSAWLSFQSKRKVSEVDLLHFFETMKQLDSRLVISARTSQRKNIGSSVVYTTEKGILTLTSEQENHLLKFSKGDRLIDWS